MLQRQRAESALLQARREEKLRTEVWEQASSQMKLLAEMSDLLQACSTSNEARQIAQRALQRFFPDDAGIVYLNNLIGTSLETFTSWNSARLMSKETLQPRECWALRRGRPHVISPSSPAIRCTHLQDGSPDRSVCIPMMGARPVSWSIPFGMG
jgi:hypothetical protein